MTNNRLQVHQTAEEPDKALIEVFTATEAAQLWGLDASTVKKACQQNRTECKKSAGTWLVTRSGMEKLYGSQP